MIVIAAGKALIKGRYEGTLHVEKLLKIKSTGRVYAQVHTDRLIIEDGGTLCGYVTLGSLPPLSETKKGQSSFNNIL